MSEKKKPASRSGKKAIQAFVSDVSMQRFRAACALDGSDQYLVIERLINEFADRMGIPAKPPKPPK